MKTEKYNCVNQSHTSRGIACWSDEKTVFFIDKKGIVNIGDTVILNRDNKGFYKSISVNGNKAHLI